MKAHFSITFGNPTIRTDPPFDMAGEFINALKSVDSAERLLSMIDRVASGIEAYEVSSQDDAELTLSHSEGVGHFWIDYPDGERECDIPIEEIHKVLTQWIDFLREKR